MVRRILMPQKPACLDPTGQEKVEIQAMLRRCGLGELWVHSDCIAWLISFAADEVHGMGVMAPKCNTTAPSRLPNCDKFPGLHRSYSNLWNKICFEWVEGPPELVKHKRCMALKSLTGEMVRMLHPQCDAVDELAHEARWAVADHVVDAWAQSILDDKEAAFLDRAGLTTRTDPLN